MKKILILGILFLYFGNTFGQPERKIPFSVGIAAHIKKYNQKSNQAYKDQDLEYAQFLFDSLVDNHLKGTYMDNFSMSPTKGDPIDFSTFEKPIFLITYATWCVPGVGEIPALNDLIDKFHDQIDFVVLFWDTRESLKEKENEYSQNAHLLYVNEKTNQNSYIINNLKHSLGFPMMYFLDADKKLLDIRKIVTHHSSETLSNSYSIHYNSLSKGVSLLITDLDLNQSETNKENELNEEDKRTREERDIDEEYERYRREKDSIDNQKR
ncbi:redoxin domain-containing protein [Aquimarina sp. RZ0]|uniref:TlpA family protein disulfide reductase n=1 Tax=Aquimarina sp. RZ0 TaxID=2607730 RepID=UPI0011F3F649|nr:redoxin domain-containing protein [Aquimarina sp. RZ0]KAA1244149.1 redoxin domain-containing protein [Aquimarina sp. RZ0]